MAIDYAGITPMLLVDTGDLQGTEKLSPQNGKLVRNKNGVCMSMVVDWIQKCQQTPGGVTDKSQLKSGLSLALAQTAYMRDAFGAESGPDAFIESHGMNVDGSTTLKKKFFAFKKGRYQQVAAACAGMHGYAQISIYGDGGHALGFRREKGVVQFFDPNEGILQFTSGTDFAKWFPSYITHEYPDLLDEIIMRKVKS